MAKGEVGGGKIEPEDKLEGRAGVWGSRGEEIGEEVGEKDEAEEDPETLVTARVRDIDPERENTGGEDDKAGGEGEIEVKGEGVDWNCGSGARLCRL